MNDYDNHLYPLSHLELLLKSLGSLKYELLALSPKANYEIAESLIEYIFFMMQSFEKPSPCVILSVCIMKLLVDLF